MYIYLYNIYIYISVIHMYTEKEADIGRDGDIQRNRDREGRRQRMMEQKDNWLNQRKKWEKN